MSAQLGSSIVLGYGPQGAQHGGAGLVLSYSPPAPVRRTVASTLGAPWAAARAHQAPTRAIMLHTVPADHDRRAPWQRGAIRGAQCRQPWQVTDRRDAQRAAVWRSFATNQAATHHVPWVLSARRDTAQASHWMAFATALSLQPHVGWAVALPLDAVRSGPWGRYATALAKSAATNWATARTADAQRWAPWLRFSRALSPGWGVITPPNTTPNEALFAILPARFYMTVHNVFAQRLPDMVDVPIFDASVSADSGSYCWTMQASGPASLFELLAPVGGLPAQIMLTMDGLPWVFAVDSVSRNAVFGKTGVSVQGRSVTALIAAPYVRATTRTNATDMTAQQIALAALTGTGIDLDWGIGAGVSANGGLVDWLVPAGVWSHQGTPLDAVQAIVQAAGGHLQSHRSAATLLARHPYGQRIGDASGAPWAWGTGAADVELATDALITEAVQRRDGPDINAVYASGTVAGVLALVKRTGTAGDKLAQMVTDPLITHVDVARQRGLSILGTAGHKYAVTLDLPVLTGPGQPGVLDVGQLVQVNTATPWRGRVRGVSVQAKMPSLRQSVTLERHLEVA